MGVLFLNGRPKMLPNNQFLRDLFKRDSAEFH